MNTPVTLETLMAQAQSGDQRAYRDLLRTITPMIRAYLRRRLYDQGPLDDLSQDILLKVHAYRDTYDPGQRLAPWIYSIASNTLIDHLRARGVRAKIIEYTDEIDVLGSAAGAGDAEAAVALREAIDLLPGDQREAMERIKVLGDSPENAGASAGITGGAAKVRAHRAYKAFLAVFKSGDG